MLPTQCLLKWLAVLTVLQLVTDGLNFPFSFKRKSIQSSLLDCCRCPVLKVVCSDGRYAAPYSGERPPLMETDLPNTCTVLSECLYQ